MPSRLASVPVIDTGRVMEELIKRAVEDFGDLVSVLGGTTDVTDPALPVRFEQYELVSSTDT